MFKTNLRIIILALYILIVKEYGELIITLYHANGTEVRLGFRVAVLAIAGRREIGTL